MSRLEYPEHIFKRTERSCSMEIRTFVFKMKAQTKRIINEEGLRWFTTTINETYNERKNRVYAKIEKVFRIVLFKLKYARINFIFFK